MSRRNGLLIAAVLAALLIVVGGALVLAYLRQNSSATTLPSTITQQTWKLESFTFDGQPQVLVPGVSVTLSFDAHAQEVSGFNGCNSYGASYTVSNNQLHFGPFRQTLIACLESGVSEQETHYMTALSLITSYHFDQSGLTLQDNTGRYVLHFTAAAG